MQFRFFCLIFGVALLCGCGPFSEVVRVDQPEARNALERVKIVKRDDLKDRKFELIQTVTALSCKNKMWDPDPTETDAIDQMRLKAIGFGANAITGIYCEKPSSFNLGTNCWSGIACSSSAVLISN